MRIKIILFSFFLNAILFVHGQEIPPKKIETKFFRPSLSNFFVWSNSSEANIIIKAAQKVDLDSRFDNNNLSESILRLNIGKEPVYVPEGDVVEMIAANAQYKKDLNAEVNKKLEAISRSIIGKWFSVNSNGEMSDELINQRGNYTATDTDVIKDRAAGISRLNQLGYDLINRSYVAIYRISSIKNMEQVYNEQDAAASKIAAKLKKSYTPVKRTMEGYQIGYTVSIYKLNWSEEVSTNFYNNFYVDASTDKIEKQTKINAFRQSSFPMIFMGEFSGEVSAIQSNNPESYILSKRKSMEQLLEESFPKIQEDALFKSSKKIEDFKVKATLVSNYPTLSKIGTKEGIYLDQRFFVYELNGDKKNKKGIVTVAKIFDNSQVANGETIPSRFRQASGKKIEPFHFLESNEDTGLSFTLGYTPGTEVNAANGFYVSVDARANRFKKVKGANSSTLSRGVNFSLNLAYNSINEKVFTSDLKNSEGSSLLLGVSLGKEMPLTKKGNIYIFPQVGINFLSYDFTKWNGSEITDLYKDNKAWSAISANFSFGVGLNIVHNLSFIIKPNYQMVVSKFKDDEKNDIKNEYLLNSKWANLNDATSFVTFGLRLKL